jgi:trigger factor
MEGKSLFPSTHETLHKGAIVSVTKEITRLEKSNVKLSLTVPKEDVQVQYQELLKDFTKDAQLPGFRKGKVPQEILVRKFGDAIKGEALSKIVEKAIGDVFQDESLPRHERPLPYAQPVLEDKPELEFDKDLSFSLIYDVLPQVKVGQWKGLNVEVPLAEVGDEDIARELEEIRERNAFVLDRDEEAQAKLGDVATLNYCELGENGEELPNSRRDDFAFTLGSKLNAYQIDDDITGMKKGETKTVTKTYPEDPDKKTLLAGRTITLQITLTALKEKKLPDLDDELAQDVDEKFSTLDDLKNSIRERLEKSLVLRTRDVKINKLLEKIMELTPLTLPESMVKMELDRRLRNTAQRFGTDVEGLLRIMSGSGNDLGDIEKSWKAQAERSLHFRLIVETLMEEQNLEASDGEVEQEFEKVAADTGLSVEDAKKQYGDQNGREYIKEGIKENKLFDMFLAENTIKTGKRTNYLDFMNKSE